MESDIKRIMNENGVRRIHFSIPWVVGPVIYVFGLFLSMATGNLIRFLNDYPWACLLAVITIAIGSSHHLTERHAIHTISIRKVFNITDEQFKTLLESNMRRLLTTKNLVFGLIFLPALLWAYTQRLWWADYFQPTFFDFYYLVILVFILLYYAGMMFGAAISCNQNVYTMCMKTPINMEYLLDEGQPLFQKLWGGQILRVTIIALVMSALTNIPIMLYSGNTSIIINLAIALTLTAFIFIVPHYMFHNMLEKAKEEMIHKISEERRMLAFHEEKQKGVRTIDDVGRMLDVIYLTQYEGIVSNRSTWLVNLEVVAELLVVGSLHVTFMELLNLLMHKS